MTTRSRPGMLVAATCVAATLVACASTGKSGGGTLAGTSWQLVRFQGGDGAVLTPDDPSKYTLTFNADGSVQARFDCNSGRGIYTLNPPSGLEFGTVVMSRTECPPPSLYGDLARRWSYIRSYVIRDGHLHMSMMADGGIFEWAPAR